MRMVSLLSDPLVICLVTETSLESACFKWISDDVTGNIPEITLANVQSQSLQRVMSQLVLE